MTRVATIPAETDLLCEGCGYVLNGLPAGANCPECGKPTDESSPALRHPPPWELAGTGGRWRAFWRTTAAILFTPTRFFRSLALAGDAGGSNTSLRFAQIHWGIASFLFACAAWAHWDWYVNLGGNPSPRAGPWRNIELGITWPLSFVALVLIHRVMAWVTTWEAGYRGLRLPLPTVRRGLHYHAPHYLPVGLMAAGTVVGYQVLLRLDIAGGASGATYLYVLCAEVIASAAYLFSTYWTAMRNLIYANRC